MTRRERVASMMASAVSALCLFTLPLYASEGTTPAGPIGGSDIRSALLPPPGIYGAAVGVGFDFYGWNTANDRIPASGGLGIGGVGLLYVYDQEMFGGSIASSVSASVQSVCLRVANSPRSCMTGLGDTYSDLLMWSRFFPSSEFSGQPGDSPPIPYGLGILVGLGLTVPTGKYVGPEAVNIGGNVFDIAPNIAVTYTTPSLLGPHFGQATEFSARVFLNNYTENPKTDYQTGRIVSVDFAITQRSNQWQYGLAGSGYFQIEDDTVRGTKVGEDGIRARDLSIGPVISYDFAANGHPWSATLKSLTAVTGEYALSSTAVVFRVATKF